MCKTKDNSLNYLIHEHFDEIKNNELYVKSVTKNGRNCVYWPHYSLRPSLLKTEIFKTLGYFTNVNGFFERDYANKFFDNNYISCFFNKVVCRHIGKLTSEKNGINAYNLNNVSQFSSDDNNYKYKLYESSKTQKDGKLRKLKE